MRKLILAASLLLLGAGLAPAQELFPLQAVATSGSGCSSYSGSICPAGSWTNVFDDEFPGTSLSSAWKEANPEGGCDTQFTGDCTNNPVYQDCNDALYVNNGVMGIKTVGTVGYGQATAANPGYGCVIYTLYPSAPHLFIETYVNYDNAPGWPAAGWITGTATPPNGICSGQPSDNFELDTMQVGEVDAFWCTYGGDFAEYYNQPFNGWHEISVELDSEAGWTMREDGIVRGQDNPYGCSAATPCAWQGGPGSNGLDIWQYTTDGHQNSTGLLTKWVRIFSHN